MWCRGAMHAYECMALAMLVSAAMCAHTAQLQVLVY